MPMTHRNDIHSSCSVAPVARRIVSARAQTTDAPANVQTPFAPVQTEEQFFGVMKALVDAGKFPAKLMPLWQDFYNNYKTAVLGSGLNDATFVAQVQAAIADRVVSQFIAPYEFPSFHTRLLGTRNKRSGDSVARPGTRATAPNRSDPNPDPDPGPNPDPDPDPHPNPDRNPISTSSICRAVRLLQLWSALRGRPDRLQHVVPGQSRALRADGRAD